MTKQFTKRTEDFICDVCGNLVHGTGYTNHCPHCLSSKHVDDIFPGDRASDCKGVMRAVAIEIKRGEWVITQKCEKCGHIRKNKSSDKDSQKALRALSSGNIDDYINDMLRRK